MPVTSRPAAQGLRSPFGQALLNSLTSQLLDFSTAIVDRNHRQEPQRKTHNLSGRPWLPAQPHQTILAYTVAFVKRKMRGDKKSSAIMKSAAGRDIRSLMSASFAAANPDRASAIAPKKPRFSKPNILDACRRLN